MARFLFGFLPSIYSNNVFCPFFFRICNGRTSILVLILYKGWGRRSGSSQVRNYGGSGVRGRGGRPL